MLHIDNKYIRLVSGHLRNFKQKKENLYNFSCPFCGDSKTNKYKARGYLFNKSGSLIYTCHNCGHGTNLAGLLGQVSQGLLQEYKMEMFLEKSGEKSSGSSVSDYNKFKVDTNRLSGKNQVKSMLLDFPEKPKTYNYAEFISDLPKDHPAKEYILSRKIPQEKYDRLLYISNYKKFVESIFPENSREIGEDCRIGILIFDELGNLHGVLGRALGEVNKKVRYLTIPLTNSKDRLIYGIDTVDKSKPIIVVEGAFDSMFLDNCIAAGTSNLKVIADYLVKQGFQKDNFILVPDTQPRNKEIVKIAERIVNSGYKISFFPDVLLKHGKDINEFVLGGIPKENIQKIILDSAESGLKAQLNFVKWKKVQ